MHFQHPFSSPKMYGLHQAPHIEHSYISATNVFGSGTQSSWRSFRSIGYPALLVCRSCTWHSSKTVRYNWYVYLRNPFPSQDKFCRTPTGNTAPIKNSHTRFQYNPPGPNSRLSPIEHQITDASNVTLYLGQVQGTVVASFINHANVTNAFQHLPSHWQVHHSIWEFQFGILAIMLN